MSSSIDLLGLLAPLLTVEEPTFIHLDAAEDRYDHIVEEGGKYVLMSKRHPGRKLGTFATREEAVKREQQILAHMADKAPNDLEPTEEENLTEELQQHMDAVWKTSYVNNLPDSHFLYVEPGGKKDAEGKTVPRSLRHFPYKDDTGSVDVVHVRNAIGRIPQSSLSSELKARLQERAKKLLHSEGGEKKMDEVSRVDVFHLDASQFQRTAQGGLRGPGRLTKVGVFPYRHKDGRIVREYRPAEEVFHKDSMSTLEDAPVTHGHPLEGDGFVNPENYSRLSKGHVTGVHKDGEGITSDVLIQDRNLAEEVISGRSRQMSAGYVSKLDWSPGMWNGQPYDAVQRNIRYNHVAVVPRGRQGPDVALRFDAASIQEEPMIVTFNGKSFDLADAEQRAAYEAANKTRADQAEARADALEAELKPLKAEKAAAARRDLEAQAKRLPKGKEAKFDGLSDRQVRESALGVDCNGKSDEYVAARFDQALEALGSDDVMEQARRALLAPPRAPDTTPAQPPNWTERWKQPLTASKDK